MALRTWIVWAEYTGGPPLKLLELRAHTYARAYAKAVREVAAHRTELVRIEEVNARGAESS